ncbi:MAG TPA: F0F1 ATP synthase subunit B [Candidatus Saccharimonadales bacterium]|jgi:F-type H+-transporting ATPase subunit b|nr:F0F1 ATP synthase subunit B [Candidatus Saccharimonadales bacterium]
MTHFILLASLGSDLAKTASDTAERFGLDWPHFIAQCISFLIVAGLLLKFAYKPILTVLAERRQRIAEGLANADKIKQELARTEAMQREVLQKANAQATKLIEEARAAAARVQEQETQKAIAQAEQIITKAREATVMERQRMLTDLKREVVGLVVQVASATTGKILTAEDQQRLAEETRRQLAA